MSSAFGGMSSGGMSGGSFSGGGFSGGPGSTLRARPTEIVPGPHPKSRTRWPGLRCGSR